MYCDKQAMLDRFGVEELIQITNRYGGDFIDETTLDLAISDAGAEIDGWLAKRYPLPLADVPPALALCACNIARYYLYADQPTETVTSRYDNAVKWLRAVALGDAELVSPSGATEETAGVAEFVPGRSVFPGGGF